MEILLGVAALVAAFAFAGLAYMVLDGIRKFNARMKAIVYYREEINNTLKALGSLW